MAAVPNNNRLEPRTAALQQSIWRVTGEDAFRRNVVRLAQACNGVAWTTDIVTQTTQPIAGMAVGPEWSTARASDYRLPLRVESRLSNDLAFIAAAQEGVHSVTAACIEENNGGAGTGLTLTLRLAANGGVPGNVQSALEDIWRTVQAGAGQAGSGSTALQDTVFKKIVRLNCTRMLQRIRNALGYLPGFLGVRPGVTTAGTKGLKLAVESMQQDRRLTAFGRSFAANLAELELDFRAISTKWTPRDAALSHDDVVVERLQAVSKQAFQLTTTGQNGDRVLLSEILKQTGLDVRSWLDNKSLAEVDKIGAYRRVAKSIVQAYREISNASAMKNVELEIITLLPYRPVQSGISRKISRSKPHVDCFVHAEIQLLCHYVLEQLTTERRLPRVMGTSKLSCFLCFLCISCYGGLKPPLPHGQIFDQWTVPDLVQYDQQAVTQLRYTIALMNTTVLRLSKEKYLSKNFPLTSRVHIDEVPRSSVEGSHSRSPCTTEMSEISRAKKLNSSTSGAYSAVSDVVLNGSRAPSSPAHSVGSTSSGCSNGQWVAVSASTQSWILRQAPTVEILVEAEGPCTGQARLEQLTLSEGKPEATASIAVDELLLGEDHVFSRKGDQPRLIFDFKLADGSEVHRLTLRWVKPLQGNV